MSTRDGERVGWWERLQERRTGMTKAQQILAKNPDADVPGYLLTDEEMDAWREGGDWWTAGPDRQGDAEADTDAWGFGGDREAG